MHYRNCERLDVLVFKTPINQRPMAKMRVDQLKYDNKHIQVTNLLLHSFEFLETLPTDNLPVILANVRQ